MTRLSFTDSQKIVLKKQDSVGVNEALDDTDYLLHCFIDMGDLEQIKDFSSKKCLLLGRTGAGKTALITKLRDEMGDKVIVIEPEALAMHHLSNSTIIQYLVKLDIDLNTFFKLLWRHEICVEIFNQHTKIMSETEHQNFIDEVKYRFKKKNTKHYKALEYLEKYRDTFWKTSDTYATTMVTKQEDEINAGLVAAVPNFTAKISGADKFTKEETQKIRQNAQTIVNDVQMRDVMGLLDMLDDFIEYNQVKYYVVVDRLDEKWVGNDIRYKLIKSLIETLKDLNRLKNIKPIATLRYDLLGRVFDISKDTGFQEEKYYPLYLDIRWNRNKLIELLNERINYQFSLRYAKKTMITYEDIFPSTIGGRPVMDYLLERTLMRPRDVIEFVNFCIALAVENHGYIDERIVLEAEKIYSRSRLDSLYYEWSADYPGLKELAKFLKKKPSVFKVEDIRPNEIQELCLKYATNPPKTDVDTPDSMLRLATDASESRLSIQEFVKHLVILMYRVGIVGLREDSEASPQWNKLITPKIDCDDIEDATEIHVHPCYISALRVGRNS